MNGTSWLLGGGNPWHSASPETGPPNAAAGAVVANDRTGLSLASLASGPLGLASADDSLGQLVLPRGIAVHDGSVFVLSQDGALVYRYDAVHEALVPLLHIGAQGLCGPQPDEVFLEPRRFRNACAIAVLNGVLYVADPGARRVQVFDLQTLALLRIHDGLGEPADLASTADSVYVLDHETGRVYRATPACDQLETVIDLPAAGSAHRSSLAGRGRHWDRLAVDRQGRLYLRYRCGDHIELDVFDLSCCLPATHIHERIYDSAQVRDRFDPPPITLNAAGSLQLPEYLLDPCGLRRPLAEGVPRWDVVDRLYVADPGSRTLRVYLADGRLRHRFGPLDASGNQVQNDSPGTWSPADLVVVEGSAVILDDRNRTVFAHRLGDATLQRWFAAPAVLERQWHRIAADKAGCLLLWDGTGDIVDRFTQQGQALGAVPLHRVRALFDCVRSTRQPAARREGVALTRTGARPRPVAVAHAWPVPRFAATGVWTSEWLDSGIHDCTWHLVELSIGRLPPGTGILVRTRTSNEGRRAGEPGTDADPAGTGGSWQDMPRFNAVAQPEPGAEPGLESELLVQSGPGQYLQLRIELTGDGVQTPVIDSVRLRFPRESLLQYLPAIFSSPPEQQAFLDRFLSIMQTTWSGLEREVETFERYLDPDSVPPAAMSYLAGWLDLQLEGTWTPEQNRRLLHAMPRLRPKWGTVDGLREWVRVYLANLGSIEVHELEQLGVPGIVESFVERRRLMLADGGAELGASDGLWSPTVERRFQLGGFDRLGDVELVSTGDPQADIFRHYAHSFRVYVPAVLIRTSGDEALVRRAIELQKPAHATYELVLVEPRFRIGVQSTIELDTVIGAPLAGPLQCAAIDDAPGREPHHRLGFDTLLGSERANDGCNPLLRSLA